MRAAETAESWCLRLLSNKTHRKWDYADKHVFLKGIGLNNLIRVGHICSFRPAQSHSFITLSPFRPIYRKQCSSQIFTVLWDTFWNRDYIQPRTHNRLLKDFEQGGGGMILLAGVFIILNLKLKSTSRVFKLNSCQSHTVLFRVRCSDGWQIICNAFLVFGPNRMMWILSCWYVWLIS